MSSNGFRVVDGFTSTMCSGVAAVSGYEPWPMRSMASVKETLASGIPVLMRFHCAADYPTGEEDSDKRLDMESHAILLIGYDDAKEVFHIVDPWRKDWDGAFSGKRDLSYEDYCLLMVNGSAEKATTLALPDTNVTLRRQGSRRFLDLEIGFYRPRGYVLDEKRTAFTSIEVAVKIEESVVSRSVSGRWEIGQKAHLSFAVPEDVMGEATAKFNAKITIEGVRPYKYQDLMTYRFEASFDAGARSDLASTCVHERRTVAV